MNTILKDKAEQYGYNSMNDIEIIKLTGYKGQPENFYNSPQFKAFKEMMNREKRQEQKKITQSSDTYQYFKFMEDLDHEQFHVLLLNNRLGIIKSVFIGKGNEVGTVVNKKEVLRQVIENKATNVILVHNHPSGTMQPSTADSRITEELKQAIRLVDSNLCDHLIVGKGIEGKLYYSFADEGNI
jgi:DNA repair protein RadC